MLIRVGGASAIPALLRELGVEPEALLRRARLDPQVLENADALILYHRLGALLDLCASETLRPHFGLLVAERAGPGYLGALHAIARNSPDVGAALANLIRYFHHHDQAAFANLTVSGDEARLEYLTPPRIAGRDVIGDGAMGIAHSLMRELGPPDWRADKVLLTRERPADPGPYAAFFGPSIRFGATTNALVFSARWLHAPIPTASKDLRTLIEHYLDKKDRRHPTRFADHLRRVLIAGMGAIEPTIEKAAANLAMSPRTLSRRLGKENATFREILDAARFEIGRELIENSDASMMEIAQLLGYSEPSVFIRAFRRWSGSTPNAWRRRSGATADQSSAS